VSRHVTHAFPEIIRRRELGTYRSDGYESRSTGKARLTVWSPPGPDRGGADPVVVVVVVVVVMGLAEALP